MTRPLPAAAHRTCRNRLPMVENGFLLTALGWMTCAIAIAGSGQAAGESHEFHAADLPRPIPEVALVTDSFLDVTVPGTVDDVDVFLDLAHEDIGDLDVFLIKDGRQVQLFNQHGPGMQDLPSILFDDEAAQPINAVPGPLAPGSFQPTSSPEPGVSRHLSLFDGVTAAGMWKLRVLDNWPDSEEGELIGWGITFSISVTALPGDANLDRNVDDLDASILAGHWRQSSGALWGDGDFNDDGRVDDRDAAILAAHWSVNTGESGATPSPIPEPTTEVAILTGALLCLARARGKTSRRRDGSGWNTSIRKNSP